MNYDLTTHGRTVGELRKHLSGTLDFGLSDGAIKGIDVASLIATAQARLTGNTTEATAGGTTRFDEFSGSMTLTNGVAKTTDFTAGSEEFDVTAQGSVNLVALTLDYTLNPVLKQAPEGSRLQSIVGKTIPVSLTGSVTSPKIRIDLQSLLRAEAQERVDEERARIEERVDAETERARDRLRNRLGDFLNRGNQDQDADSSTEDTDDNGT